MKNFITAVAVVVSLSSCASLPITETAPDYQDTLVMANQGDADAQYYIGYMYDE